MRCTICGAETETNDDKCSACRHAELKILTPEEKTHFTGVTIEAETNNDSKDSNNSYQYSDRGGNQRLYIKQVNFGSKNSFFSKLLIFAVIAGILFIALPVALVLAAIFSLVWFIFRK